MLDAKFQSRDAKESLLLENKIKKIRSEK